MDWETSRLVWSITNIITGILCILIISKKAKLSGELVAAQPCIEEVANTGRVRALFSSLDGNPTRKAGQMAWNLLFYALWYRFHIDRKPCDGDVFHNLSIANSR